MLICLGFQYTNDPGLSCSRHGIGASTTMLEFQWSAVGVDKHRRADIYFQQHCEDN